MEVFKKICRCLLFPHPAVIIALFPLTVASMLVVFFEYGSENILAYITYALSAYELTVICMRIPQIIKWVNNIRESNKYISRYQNDAAWRIKLSLYGTVLYNTVYAAFMIGQGVKKRSFWFFSLAAYYIILDVVRLTLLRYMRSSSPRERMLDELKRYRFCGKMLAYMNIALAFIVFFVVYWNRGYEYSYIMTIAMAAYTFTAFTTAIVGAVRYRKYNSPIMSASRAISLAAACVSMLTLETAMLTAFATDGEAGFRRTMTLLTGIAVLAFIFVMAIYMIKRANKRIKKTEAEGE